MLLIEHLVVVEGRQPNRQSVDLVRIHEAGGAGRRLGLGVLREAGDREGAQRECEGESLHDILLVEARPRHQWGLGGNWHP